ncbi:bacterial Ig-like domain-containing protein [uncultured Microbacterium sp.]|uniref:bacterial Ig-like domain-containing protein n=1 Tax=uncultured Microbacterium sp. TaxID=191216 RepID=UPI0026149092|nr:bacterial Ig-like domain-containing protein [uncultured Microbacterium sp.]
MVNVYCYTPGGSPATTSYCDDITLTKVTPESARITTGPTDAAVPAGANAHFHVDVDADHPYAVRWESSANGEEWATVTQDLVGGAVADGTRWLSVSDVAPGDAGTQYRAIVTDAATGQSAVSAAATLRVTEPPASAAGALTGLTIAAGPTKAVYLVDDALDLTGLALRAQYEGGSYSVADPTLLQVASSGATARLGQREVAVSFTDGDVTVSTSFTITVVGSVSKTVTCKDIGATVTASFSQTEYGAQPATNACDNNAGTSWSTWRSNSTRTAEMLTLAFAQPQSIQGMSIDWVESSFAGPVTLSYLGEDQEWHQLGDALTTIVGGTTRAIEGAAPVKTTSVRLNVTYGNTTYLKISEVRLLTAETRTPSADASLAALTIDGAGVEGFAGETLAYAADAPSVKSLPQVAATPTHPGAEVTVTQPTFENPVASITVVAADTLSTTTYAVSFAIAGVSSIAVDTSNATVAYTVGDAADLSGLVVTATYATGETVDVTAEAEVGALSTATAGVVSVPVSYSWRGTAVTSSFDVIVTAKPAGNGGGGAGTPGGPGTPGGTAGAGTAPSTSGGTVRGPATAPRAEATVVEPAAEAQPTPTATPSATATPKPSATSAPSATTAPDDDDTAPVDAAGEPASSGGDWTWAILGLVGLLVIGGAGALTIWMRRSRV